LEAKSNAPALSGDENKVIYEYGLNPVIIYDLAT
jgi:hypothetical protein